MIDFSNSNLQLLLSYPLGLITNITSDKIKQLSDKLCRDKAHPLKKIFIESLIRAIDEHNNHFDEVSASITNKLKKVIREDENAILDLFIEFSNEENLFYMIRNLDFQEKVSEGICLRYLEGINDLELTKSIILDCLVYYQNSFFIYMNEKDALIAILENSFEVRDEILELKHAVQEIMKCCNFMNKYSNYKNSLLTKISKVNYFGLGVEKYKNKTKKELEKVYIKPNFKRIDDGFYRNIQKYVKESVINNKNDYETDENDILDLADLLDVINDEKNVVVLGDPGSGKSILIKYLIWLVISHQIDFTKNRNLLKRIPFWIELRSYNKDRKTLKCSIINYVNSQLELLQVGYGNKLNLEELFTREDTIVFFDGLDEIFDITEKNNVRDDIVNFINNYPKSRAFVTSRIIGYDDAPFDKNFIEFKILDFNNIQIEDYVKRWYLCSAIDSCNENEKSEILHHIEELTQQIYTLEDELIRNPLLLSLIIILYQNNEQLPNSKLELYKNCSKTLVENWDFDKQLEININEKLKSRKENIFSAIALWQYLSESKKSGDIKIDNDTVTKKVKESILELEITEDLDEAENYARDFLYYAEKRSLYFDNTFTHKTFWEYYTAVRIYQQYFLGDKLECYHIIDEYINNSFWFNVLHLLINIIDKEQISNNEINNIVEVALNKRNINCIFFLRILPSLVHISDKCVKEVIKQSIMLCVNSKSMISKNNYIDLTEDTNINIFDDIISFIRKGKFECIFCKSIDEIIDEIDCDKYTDLFLLYRSINVVGEKIIKLEKSEYLANKVYSQKEQNIYVFHDYLRQKIDNINEYTICMVEFSKLFGNKNLTIHQEIPYATNAIYIPPVQKYFNKQFSKEHIDTAIENISYLIDNIKGFNKFSVRKDYLYGYSYGSLDLALCNLYFEIINKTERWEVIFILINIYINSTIINISKLINDREYNEYIFTLFKDHRHSYSIYKHIEKHIKAYSNHLQSEVAVTSDS